MIVKAVRHLEPTPEDDETLVKKITHESQMTFPKNPEINPISKDYAKLLELVAEPDIWYSAHRNAKSFDPRICRKKSERGIKRTQGRNLPPRHCRDKNLVFVNLGFGTRPWPNASLSVLYHSQSRERNDHIRRETQNRQKM
jgi:hypothetical protein